MELMVVIVIVAILAAVAVPLYINYVKDAARTEAKGAIGALITAEQTFYQKTGSYTADTTKLNVDLTDVKNNWKFTIATADPSQGFSVTADGQGQTTNKLMVKCTYARGTDPIWEEH